jgi:hypothetical protein
MQPAETIALFPAACGPDSVSNSGAADTGFGPLTFGEFDELVELDKLQARPRTAGAKEIKRRITRRGFIMNITL